MISKEWEDICISFDEYGMQPATLCDDEKVINNFREAFKNVLKDLEMLEILIKNIKLIDYRIFYDKVVIFLPVNYRKELEEINRRLEDGKDYL